MIEVSNLTFSYPSTNSPILENFSLQIEAGETISIMGANGSGKTTLARCLNGLLLPTAGDVRVDSLNTKIREENLKIRSLLGMVFQNPDNQIVSTTVEREIAFGLENLSVPTPKMRQRVDEILRQFDLEKYRYQSPHYLSGGEKQLLALSSIFAMAPKYIIFDEPTSLLDPYSREKILDAIFDLQSESDITPILITQFPEETLRTERLVILDKGKIILDGKPTEIFENADLLGEIGIAAPPLFQIKSLLTKMNLWEAL